MASQVCFDLDFTIGSRGREFAHLHSNTLSRSSFGLVQGFFGRGFVDVLLAAIGADLRPAWRTRMVSGPRSRVEVAVPGWVSPFLPRGHFTACVAFCSLDGDDDEKCRAGL